MKIQRNASLRVTCGGRLGAAVRRPGVGMRRTRVRNRVGIGLLLGWSLAGACQTALPGVGSGRSSYAGQNTPLPAEQVARKLQENNAQRAAALEQFNGTRVYRMRYRGFPSDKDAEMVVNVTYHAPNAKEFSVVSQTGS